MDPVPPSIRDLARRLLASTAVATDAPLREMLQACEPLRLSMTRFAGVDGYRALIGRALALSSAEVPSLKHVRLGAGGRLEALEGFAMEVGDPAVEAAVAIISHVIDLLVALVGEPITLTLLRDAWPNALLNEPHSHQADV